MQNIVQPAEAGLIPETFADSPFAYSRFRTREVKVGNVGVGGTNPIRIQSMTISDTMDTEATVKEAIGLIEAGCEIVRITAPRVKEAENLKNIKNRLVDLGYNQPLVADIHFLPQAAMTAVEYVEKVRINPGNFADRKFFELREYTDSQYEEELERIHDAFRPLVLRARELGRALRIGTNHGSLSDRIMNRYGDTALGMVESALEFIRIAEHYDFRDIIISMKASNPGVMIQAYRLLVARFRRENMDYPLHLGVTEAGGGKDGRIKSSIGIGSLLDDGIGDTIRVSLTEDSIHEIPVARKIASYYDARRALAGTSENGKKELEKIYIQSFPYHRYDRRGSDACTVIGGKNPIKIGMREELVRPEDAASLKARGLDFVISKNQTPSSNSGLPVIGADLLSDVSLFAPEELETAVPQMKSAKMVSIHTNEQDITRSTRLAAAAMKQNGLNLPIILFARFSSLEEALYQASIHFGGLLLDGIGDALVIDIAGAGPDQANHLLDLSLDVLQATRLRLSKTEFISCPSCGRTLFDLQDTTARIQKRTGHLKGVKIAIMGCVVNGPGEMADADFGYVGAGPGKIHLYRGKEIVKKSIPSEIADEELVRLIQEHGMWVEPGAG
ncbi:MAG TPA: (E)-4-hydroxy-3-methylbut-2-enyl-diphosphate synthase [Leptospiraceae bacterium]|nr:(E)-4-hydroxy-3-methylbut-2-enyl-diphosphate synthase [Leptospiraceae bacterium]HNN58514.1 (E)-4-hydroxy-3-methylbut-2-enyl-diphosphate synthase [Leptospiraceae bacterium]